MVYFKITRKGVTEQLHTDRKLGPTVWVNNETNNVERIKPKAVRNFTEYVVKLYKRPTEKALNNSKIVL